MISFTKENKNITSVQPLRMKKTQNMSLDGLEIRAEMFLNGKKKMIQNIHAKYLTLKSPDN